MASIMEPLNAFERADQMIPDQTLEVWLEKARRDDWHERFVGSDIRLLIGDLKRARAVLHEPPSAWLPLQSAPKDGTMMWLLVDYRGDEGEHALVDNEFGATIGFNSLDNTGQDEWQFAGWCWCHDHFTEGHGNVLAWKPIGFALQPPPCFRPLPVSGTA